MKVSQLINILQAMPKDAAVWCVWDGEPRTEVNAIWLARSGAVMLAEPGDIVYSAASRPASAPDVRYWRVPEMSSQEHGREK